MTGTFHSALFGRYWPAHSLIHALDPRIKIICVLMCTVSLFFITTPGGFLAIAIILACLFLMARIPPLQALRSIVPLLFIVILTALFNVLFIQGGAVLIDFGWLTISQAGVEAMLFFAIRLTLLLVVGSFLTLTTTTLDITEGITRLLRPLEILRFPVHECALILGIALRFLPQFAAEFTVIRTAQAARGARLSTSTTSKGINSLTSVLVPLFTSVFRHADTLSGAMEARCYQAHAQHTRLRPLHIGTKDIGALLVMALLLIVSIVLL